MVKNLKMFRAMCIDASKLPPGGAIEEGMTYEFKVDSTGHPFLIEKTLNF